jgi:hypothetical protein
LFITDTLLGINSNELQDKLFNYLETKEEDNRIYFNNQEQIKNCINHLFFWVNNLASRNLQREIELNLNAKTHFLREYGNWFTREVIKGAYMYIEYKDSFEAITCPLDFAIRKLNDAIFELEERKKIGTIVFDKLEIKTYYRITDTLCYIKGGLVRVFNFMNSEFPVCFVFKMRTMTEEEFYKEVKIISHTNSDQIIVPSKLSYILK